LARFAPPIETKLNTPRPPEKTVYRVGMQRSIEARLALDLLRERQARSRAETTKTLH